MILTQPTKSRTSTVMILNDSYLRLFHQALKNLELNRKEDKSETSRFTGARSKMEKAG